MYSILRFMLVLHFFLLSSTRAQSAENIPREKYIASRIPDSLIKNTNAVVRFESISFRVKSVKYATEKVHRVVTILNAEGQNYGFLELQYDKFIKIEEIDGKIYNAAGEKVRSLKNADITDYPGTSEFSLYDDNRIKSVILIHNIFPYTIEFEYELSFRGYLNWPSWYPEKANASVEYSTFEVIIPADKQLRYWKNTDIEPLIEYNENSAIYRWEAHSLLPFDWEPIGPDIFDQYKCVKIAPDQFEIEGYMGDLSSWKSFGKWIYNLYLNKQSLPDREHQKVISLTSDASDKKEKIRILYEYLQSKTRYVSIQLGIGSWQPFDANYVCEKGYGDCKALTNYMISLLNVINIPAYPALIYNDRVSRKAIRDFPSNQFNHVILFIPMEADTVWLECTSRTNIFGKIGNNNENRYALIITPEGGELVKTPSSEANDNRLIQKINLNIEYSGNAVADVQSTYTGNQQNYIRLRLKEASPKEREGWLMENIQIPLFNLKRTDFSHLESKGDNITINYELALPRYAVLSGKRLLLQPNLLNRNTYFPKAIERRRHPVVHSYPYLDMDSVIINVPENFRLEAMPKPVIVKTHFAEYSSRLDTLDKKTLLYSRYLEMSFIELPPDTYNEYRNFIQKVVQADKANVVFIRE